MERIEQNESITQMPKFNKSIEIQVDTDAIMDKLLGLLPENYKHREVLAHAIVGSAVENGTIGYIYGPLNGYTNDIDFKVEDVVFCTEEERYEMYDANIYKEDGSKVNPNVAFTPTEDYKPDMKRRRVRIGRCRVIGIDLYAKNKLRVEYESVGSYSSKKEKREAFVNHKNCTMVERRSEMTAMPEPVSY